MKPRDYHYEFVADLPDGAEKIELTIERKELRQLLDAVRDLRAKANRLATDVESFDREIDFDTLNQWQIAAQIMSFNMTLSIQLLCRWQDQIINYNRLKIQYTKQMEAAKQCH